MKSLARSISVFTISGVLAIGVSPAHAGGGMGFGAGVTTCRAVANAPDQPQTIQLSDFFGESTVAVATATFVCDLPATGNTVKGPDTVVGPAADDPNAFVTCYTVRQSDRARLPATIEDAFGTQDVNVGAIQLLCVPSFVTPK